MKIIGIDEEEKKVKKINKKRLLFTIISSILIIFAIVIISLYIWNRPFRETMDKYVLMKNVKEDNVKSIALDSNDSYSIYAYDGYISVFNNNLLTGYNSSGNKEYELEINLTNPLVDANNRFLLMAEKDKQNIYLISEKNIVWHKELDGNISRVSVNKNGYVSVVLTGTNYKSIIQVFDSNGTEMFKTYLSNSTAMATTISNDNKYLSFAEISTEGTTTQSRIKTISIQKAKETPSESIISTLTADSDKVVIDVKYQDGNKMICMYDDSICNIQNDKEEEIISLNKEGEKNIFAGIGLNNYAFRITEKNNLLSTETTVEFVNVGNRIPNTYIFDDSVKEVFTYGNYIALNLGSEVHFVETNGWLSKKYISSQEIRKIVLADNFAGIVYRDKIEIVEL